MKPYIKEAQKFMQLHRTLEFHRINANYKEHNILKDLILKSYGKNGIVTKLKTIATKTAKDCIKLELENKETQSKKRYIEGLQKVAPYFYK